jgi:actin-related protein
MDDKHSHENLADANLVKAKEKRKFKQKNNEFTSSIRMTVELRERAAIYCAQKRITFNALLTQACEKFLDDSEK